MTRKCFVRGCPSSYNSTNKQNTLEGLRRKTLFSVPQCENLRSKWDAALARSDKRLSVKDTVCELHFNETDIEKNYETIMPDGSIHKIERGKYRLKPGAIPTVDTTVLEPSPLLNLENIQTGMKNIHENFHTQQDDTVQRQIQENSQHRIHQEIEPSYDGTANGSDQDKQNMNSQFESVNNNEKVAIECQPDIQSQYNIENLKLELDKFRLPKGWAYIFIEEGVSLPHIAINSQIDINLLVDTNMKMKISTGDRKISREYSEEVKSFDGLLSHLAQLEILASSPCQGIGFDDMRAEGCSGFCTESAPSKRISFIRCHPCRLLRKKKMDRERKKRLRNKKTIQQIKREKAALLKSMTRKRDRLHSKVLKMKKKLSNCRERNCSHEGRYYNKQKNGQIISTSTRSRANLF